MYFNKNMSYPEALKTLNSIVEGKSREEIEEIKKEYREVISEITRRELRSNDGWMTSYKFN